MSSLAPSAEKSPNLSMSADTAPPQPTSPSSSHSSHSSSSSTEDFEAEEEAAPAPLAPVTAFRAPKGIAERKLNTSKLSLHQQVARRRADSLKWEKYSGGGTFELNLKPDELRRVA